MKKITLLLTLFLTCVASAQVTTGVINFTSNYSGTINIDDISVEITLVGPEDLWLGLGFGVDSMDAGGDVITHDSTGFNDRQFLGVGSPPSTDTQDWTVDSNDVVSGVRTLVVSRPIMGSDATDFVFDETAPSIMLVWAHGDGTDNFSYHGANNRDDIVVALNPVLGINEVSFDDQVKIFPVPASDLVTVSITDFNSEKATIDMFSMIGQNVYSEVISEKSTIIDISNLSTGVYILNVSTAKAATSKKIIKN